MRKLIELTETQEQNLFERREAGEETFDVAFDISKTKIRYRKK